MHIYRKYTNFLQKYDVNFKKNSTYNLIFKDGENKIYSIYNFFSLKIFVIHSLKKSIF